MIPVMMVTARPYGLWRDWFFSKTRPQRWLTNLVGDIIAFITFQVPVYVATLALAGANASEIVAAVSASIVFMILLSRPFGIYLQAVRNWATDAVRRMRTRIGLLAQPESMRSIVGAAVVASGSLTYLMGCGVN